MVEFLVWNKMFFAKKWVKNIKHKRFHILDVQPKISDNVGMLSIIRAPNFEQYHVKKWKHQRFDPGAFPVNIRRQLCMGAIVEIRDNAILKKALRRT